MLWNPAPALSEIESPEPFQGDGRLTIAVVGCGYWGAKHVRVLTGLAQIGHVIVVDPSPAARQQITAAYPAVEALGDLRSVLHRVDAVVVATPPSDHLAVALEAICSGSHALIEKPLTTTLSGARRLVEAAERFDVVLMVGHTCEFNAAVQELRRRMDDGELGDICYLHSARLNLGLYRSDVNVVWDLAPHDISIMNYLLDTSPSAVSAWGSKHQSSTVEDVAYFQLEYANRGVTGYGHVSWLDPRKIRQLTVVGTRKMAVYDDLAEERLRVFDCGVERSIGNHGSPSSDHTMPMSYWHGDVVSPHIEWEEPLRREDQHFVDSILNRTAPRSDGADGAAVVEVLEAIDQAMSTGGVVTLDRVASERGNHTALAQP